MAWRSRGKAPNRSRHRGVRRVEPVEADLVIPGAIRPPTPAALFQAVIGHDPSGGIHDHGPQPVPSGWKRALERNGLAGGNPVGELVRNGRCPPIHGQVAHLERFFGTPSLSHDGDRAHRYGARTQLCAIDNGGERPGLAAQGRRERRHSRCGGAVTNRLPCRVELPQKQLHFLAAPIDEGYRDLGAAHALRDHDGVADPTCGRVRARASRADRGRHPDCNYGAQVSH